VILPPSAVLDLVAFLWYDFAATSHKDKLSSLVGKVGQKVFGKNITVRDDFSHPLQAGPPFDGEGMPRQAVNLIEKGVVKNLVYGRRSAKHFKVESTGHGLAEPSPMGEIPTNIVLEGGNSSLAEMVATTDYGVLLSRVWYVRVVDPTSVLLTGMTRDGTFLIENGKIVKGVKNLRFNVSVIELLNNVLALGPAVRAAGEEGDPNVVPAMKVANFHFTSTTKF
jgi:PmbA protein